MLIQHWDPISLLGYPGVPDYTHMNELIKFMHLRMTNCMQKNQLNTLTHSWNYATILLPFEHALAFLTTPT